MPKITPTKGGFNIQHTTREVWGVDDDDAQDNDAGRTRMGNTPSEDQPTEGYDYTHQAWVMGGVYLDCHHVDQSCGCYGRAHKGEPTAEDAEIR